MYRHALLLLSASVLLPAQPKEALAILTARCGQCHAGSSALGGLRVDSRGAMLQGGINGPAIVPGKSSESLLIKRVTGAKPPRMPLGGAALPEAEIASLRQWIDEGAKAPAGAGGAEAWQPSLSLSRPKGTIDEALIAFLKKTPENVSDAVYARRVYLDLWGMPPSPEELDAFTKSTAAGKRSDLVRKLLANRQRFAENQISFWNDLLHNDEGVTYIGDRKTITPWLLESLEKNKPYDQMVRELLNPAAKTGPEGFLLGVNWRGDINASQTPVMQAAQNSSQVFLAVNLKCNSCHDSFISRWKLRDAYGLASFFSEKQLELVRCDAKTGEMSSPKFLYPELGSVPADASLPQRRAAAAELFTKKENGRLPRTFVNRVWKRLMGRGLVEPVDDLDAKPWSPQILDILASDFVTHGYDVDWLFTEIMTSRAYQMQSVEAPIGETRRLTAEQFIDSVSAITGAWRVLSTTKPGPGVYRREWRFKTSSLTAALGRPARDLAVTERINDPVTLQMLELVNGQTLSGLLQLGARQMLGEAVPPPAPLFDSGVVSSGPVKVDIDVSRLKKLHLVVADHDSYDPTRVKAGWAEVPKDLANGTLQFRNETSASPALLVKIPSEMTIDLTGKKLARFQARVGADASTLSSDIAPKVRFFAFAEEPDHRALTGVTGDPPVPFPPATKDPDALITRVFRHAFSRDPDPREREISRAMLKKGNLRDGLEDLLWSVFVSPEFQYIR